MTERFCRECSTKLPPNSEPWRTYCKACFVRKKRQEELDMITELARAKIRIRELEAMLDDNFGADQVERHLDLGMIRKLIQLCHPDKHNGSKMATEVTKWLNSLKSRDPW